VKLGVDFGTNRIVVPAADRGNYPLVSFEAPDGASPDWFPSLIAIRGDQRLYGWDAYNRQGDEAWTVFAQLNDSWKTRARGPSSIWVAS
jgi:molecular chaperone DnaK (HSP70)